MAALVRLKNYPPQGLVSLVCESYTEFQISEPKRSLYYEKNQEIYSRGVGHGNSPKEPTSGSSKTEAAPSSSAVSGPDEAAQTGSGEKILNAGVSFNIASMDAHLDYNGWYTNVYGITEELFKLNENYEVEPWLAEKAESDGKVWTITLKDGIAFPTGNQ